MFYPADISLPSCIFLPSTFAFQIAWSLDAMIEAESEMRA